jgi:two-component system sensor histidine kinase/response regulator
MKKGFIICVDDQPAILESLMSQLKCAVGNICEIETAESAEETLAVLDELEKNGELVEMIIVDEVMPGMKGSQLLEVVHKRFPDIIKIMLTGQAGLDDVAYAINNAGLDKYFTKPWEYEDLKLTVLNLLKKARLARKNKQLVIKLKKKYQELERAYNELASAYKHLKETQTQLIHAEKLALVGQLAGGIAHEVKNQLSTIKFAEFIRQDYPDDENVQRYVSYILTASNNIYNLIEEMRRFAKKEQRRYEMEICSVTDILNSILNFIRFDKLVAHREIITEFKESPKARLNRNKIGQVFINLIKNAAYATSEDSGEIRIDVSSDGSHALITIQDNGCGITEEHLSRIWEPFFTTKSDEGTGLGLDICKRIVEEHDGTITCTSQVDVGTIFTISLPVMSDA